MARKVSLAVLWLVTLTLVIFVVGALAYDIPYVGLTSLFVVPFAPTIALASFVATGLAVVALRLHRTTSRMVLVTLSTIAGLGASYITYAVATTFVRENVRINPLAAVLAGLPVGPAAKADTSIVFDAHAGSPVALSIYRPSRQTSPAPVIFYVHGGGWVIGDRDDAAPTLRWLADQGWLVVSTDYTLSTPSRNLWDATQGQVGCAAAWVKANIARYGGDPARIGIVGESAGGNLAINVGYMASRGQLKSSCGGEIPVFKAVSVLFPVVDPASFNRNPDLALGKPSRDMTASYTGGDPDQFPKRYASISSFTHISRQAPPTLILVGEADHLVPPAPSYKFAREAAEAGINMRLVRVPFGDHGFNIARGSLGDQGFRQLTAAWLSKHGLAPKMSAKLSARFRKCPMVGPVCVFPPQT